MGAALARALGAKDKLTGINKDAIGIAQNANKQGDITGVSTQPGGGGDGSHTHNEGGAEASLVEKNPVMEDAAPVTFKSSPAKIGGVGYNNPDFQMKASGPKYNNSPIEKNYGSPAQRGFTGGVGSKEMEGGVGAKFDAVGKYSSPAKGFWDKINPVKHIKNLAKGIKEGDMKSILSGGILGGDKDGQSKVDKLKAAAAAGGAVGGAGAGGDGAHTHGADGAVVDPTENAAAAVAADPTAGGGVAAAPASNLRAGLFSDIRLKEKIRRTGSSPSGIPVYEFNYIGGKNRYSGVMAQDLLGTDSVLKHESGYYMVDYDSIDVEIKLL